MANKELLKTIRKEIISRIDKRHLSAQARNELVSILSFLSTIQPEKPVSKDLELKQALRAEIERRWKHHRKNFLEREEDGDKMEEDACLLQYLSDLEKSEKPIIPNDLEEAAEEYEKKHTYQRYDGGGLTPEYDATLAEAFIAGYNLCKEQTEKRWLEDRDGCFWDGVAEGKKAMEDAILAIIESRLSEIMGDAQPKPAMRMELEELITRIKEDKK